MTLALLVALAFSSMPASAAPPERPLPEDTARGDHFSDGRCAVEAFRMTIEVPALDIPDDPHIPEGWKTGVRRTQQEARARLVAVRRLNQRVQKALNTIVRETNECATVWDSFDAFVSTTEAAARGLADASARAWTRRGESPAWTAVKSSDDAGDLPKPGRYAGACRAPALDDALYAPDAPDLPADARARLAEIGGAAASVSAALREQKAAVDELLPLLDGAACRETLKTFDDLLGHERAAFYAYREKAVAGALWPKLTWKKASP